MTHPFFKPEDFDKQKLWDLFRAPYDCWLEEVAHQANALLEERGVKLFAIQPPIGKPPPQVWETSRATGATHTMLGVCQREIGEKNE